MKTPALIAACLLVLASALNGALAHEHVQCGKPLVISAAGGVGDVRKAFERFQRELGGEDNGNAPGPLKKGFRSIDWDADAVPFDMPGNFFRDVVTRGLELVQTDEFRVSNPPKTDPGFPDNLFDSINKDHPNQFQAFSPERIFSPLEDNHFSILFSVPAKGDRATVAGYGAIFVDVDNEDETFLQLFGTGAKDLGRFYVPAYPQGLSFLGVICEASVITRVDVQLGNAELPQTDLPPEYEVVVMDDFLFSEPQAIVQKKPAHAPGRKEGSGYGYGR
ncbi:unnamed protein product [Ostreobium quekettii]|uniref:Uncharacterized protein n=1 Tax=Ostreobium quekettii TaxID=121088 RepID=A0A8S1J2L0_9CHLO|nr:unnamed protein product [Ostreobium quekettii]|eukprot:evm.model.scf_85EXC.6 EVM.evm.TU.scf_85EXC.6   scf_85EXC:48749-49870(-)